MTETRDVSECGRVVSTDPEGLKRVATALHLPDTADEADVLTAIGKLNAKRLN